MIAWKGAPKLSVSDSTKLQPKVKAIIQFVQEGMATMFGLVTRGWMIDIIGTSQISVNLWEVSIRNRGCEIQGTVLGALGSVGCRGLIVTKHASPWLSGPVRSEEGELNR